MSKSQETKHTDEGVFSRLRVTTTEVAVFSFRIAAIGVGAVTLGVLDHVAFGQSSMEGACPLERVTTQEDYGTLEEAA